MMAPQEQRHAEGREAVKRAVVTQFVARHPLRGLVALKEVEPRKGQTEGTYGQTSAPQVQRGCRPSPGPDEEVHGQSPG